MPKKGDPKTPGSGRKKGTPNKHRYNLQEMAENLNCNPFEILCHFANGNAKALGYKDTKVQNEKTKKWKTVKAEIPMETRVNAAKEACQYLYPKLKSIEFTGKEHGVGATLIFLPSNGREISKDN